MKMGNGQFIEFREDPVSSEWVLISTKAQSKPTFFKLKKGVPLPKSKCPFENPIKQGSGEKVLMWLPKPEKNERKDWWVMVFPNKYPVVRSSRVCPKIQKHAFYNFTDGVGFQEVVVSRDHDRHMGSMKQKEIELIIETYQARYQALRNEECVEYILLFHNSGASAGASIPHPHSQIIAIPIIPPDVGSSLKGAQSYYRKQKKCVYCETIKFEIKEKRRVVFENDLMIVVAPYASHTAYELRIYPKKHESRFEVIDTAQRRDLAGAMRFVFGVVKKKLHNPDYNFFIHTAPPNGNFSSYYHWHLEILPRVAFPGGAEQGMGVDITRVAPEQTAKFLKS
jgi:UDPglucose--hexose-1-phosphate uridylyltransferase